MTFSGPAFYDQQQVFEAYSRHREDPAAPTNTLEGPLIHSLLGDVQGHDFLDLGCGAAAFGKELLAAGAASYQGVDGSRNMVEQAERNLQGCIGRVILGDLRDWDFPAAAYSRVCARLVLHYLPELAPLLRKIHLALRPDGLLVFSVEHPFITSCS